MVLILYIQMTGGRKAISQVLEKYAEKKAVIKVKEERSLITQIVAALIADKDNKSDVVVNVKIL